MALTTLADGTYSMSSTRLSLYIPHYKTYTYLPHLEVHTGSFHLFSHEMSWMTWGDRKAKLIRKFNYILIISLLSAWHWLLRYEWSDDMASSPSSQLNDVWRYHYIHSSLAYRCRYLYLTYTYLLAAVITQLFNLPCITRCFSY